MGGDSVTPPEEGSSLYRDFALESSSLLRHDLSIKDKDDRVDNGGSEQIEKLGRGFSSASLDLETDQRRRESVHREILQSYHELLIRSRGLEEAKTKILSYKPGGWIETVGSTSLTDYDVPKTTCLLLIGPKGAGKSSLINRISKVFDDDKFAPERAQVSYSSSAGDGTFFLQEYMIPRGSTSFCLYDTRSLSDDSEDNINMLKHWMTRGVRRGELVMRDSDSRSLRTTMKCKALKSGYASCEIRKVNFVIFVVNALSVLKSMDNDEDAEENYIQLIVSAFNCPYISFRDDKPLIVVTHGDLLSQSDRARIRVYLGELLGIPPTKQIFDIPDNHDPVTELTIVNMLRHSLEHADKNLPGKRLSIKNMNKVLSPSLSSWLFLLIILGISLILAKMFSAQLHRRPEARPKLHKFLGKHEIEWHKIRHLWLDD
ncbi:hypothetical protein UlMin_031906 [Ulmus minor]